METLILNSNSKKDIEILKEIAIKFGMSVIDSSPKKESAKMRLEGFLN